MDFHQFSEPDGKYPFHTPCEAADRFQYRLIAQPVGDNIEYTLMTVDTRLQQMAADREWLGYPKRIPRPNCDRQENLRDANRRRAKKIRLYCLEMKVDRLLTLTCRTVAGRLLTRDQFLEAQDMWRRAMVKKYPDFMYIGVHELQQNGQIHFHGAIRGFVDINHARVEWQKALNRVLDLGLSDFVGPNSPGTCHVQTCPPRLLHMPLEKRQEIMAAYICKYISEDPLSFFNKKGYFHSSGVRLRKAVGRWLRAKTMREAIAEMARLYCLVDADGIPLWDKVGRGNDFFQRYRVASVALAPPF